MSVDAAWRLGVGLEMRGGDSGEDGLEHLVAQDDEGSDGTEGMGQEAIAAGAGHLSDPPLASELLEVVGGAAGTVGRGCLASNFLNLGVQLPDAEASR